MPGPRATSTPRRSPTPSAPCSSSSELVTRARVPDDRRRRRGASAPAAGPTRRSPSASTSPHCSPSSTAWPTPSAWKTRITSISPPPRGGDRAPIRRTPPMIALGPLGDRAFLARFATEDEAARVGLGRPRPGLAGRRRRRSGVPVGRRLRRPRPDRPRRPGGPPPGRDPRSGRPPLGDASIRLPVLYDGEDLPEVARRLGVTESEVITAHSGQDYFVFAIGFLPGFPYAGLPASGPERPAPARGAPGARARRFGRDRRLADGRLSGRVARGLEPARPDPVADRGPRTRPFPHPRRDRVRFEPIALSEYEARRGDLR